MAASGPSSGSKDGVPRRWDPQPDEEAGDKQEPKVEAKVEEKKELSPKEHYHLHFRGSMISFNL